MEALQANGYRLPISIAPHQPTCALASLCNIVKTKHDQVYNNIQQYGNTAASVPIAL